MGDGSQLMKVKESSIVDVEAIPATMHEDEDIYPQELMIRRSSNQED
jgi:hypothetical protein